MIFAGQVLTRVRDSTGLSNLCAAGYNALESWFEGFREQSLGHWIVNPRKLEHGFRMIIAGIHYTYLNGMRIMMFHLSGFYFRD